MSEWDGRQVSLGTVACCGFWLCGIGVMLAALIGPLPAHWASAGQVIVTAGCMRMVLREIHAQNRRERDAFELGREAGAMRLVRD